MSAFSHKNRQAILNRVYVSYRINGKRLTRSNRSVVSLFDWAGCLESDQIYGPADRYKMDTEFVDQLQRSPSLAPVLFVLDDDDELDNDDFAFLIDLESEYRSAVTAAWQQFDATRVLDTAAFRRDLSQRLDRFALNQGLDRPTLALLASASPQPKAAACQIADLA